MRDYHEHALTAGSEASAVAYVEAEGEDGDDVVGRRDEFVDPRRLPRGGGLGGESPALSDLGPSTRSSGRGPRRRRSQRGSGRARPLVRRDRLGAAKTQSDVVPPFDEALLGHRIELEGAVPARLGDFDNERGDVDDEQRRRVVLHERVELLDVARAPARTVTSPCFDELFAKMSPKEDAMTASKP